MCKSKNMYNNTVKQIQLHNHLHSYIHRAKTNSYVYKTIHN